MSDVEFFIITGISITILFIVFIVSFLFINQKRHFTYLKEKKELENIFSQTLLQSQLEIQEQTLQQISNELHDNIAQVASIIKMNLHTIKLDDISKAQQKIEDTRELVMQLITDIKSLSVQLNGDRIIQVGLPKALETEIERINKTELFTASFHKDDSTITLEDDKAIILYRMAQEILNNVVKHSNAREIKLQLSSEGNIITLEISDNGNGFNVDEMLKTGTGAGLRNLQKRAKLINASMVIKSTIEDGTYFKIELPCGVQENSMNS